MKKTTKKISAVALALVMGATAFTGCSGSTNSTPGGTDSAASTTSGGAATGSQKKMSSNENVKSAVDNVSVGEDYKDIKVDTKLKFMAWYDIQEASPAVELFKTLYGTPKNKPEGYESVADENVFVNVKVSNYNNRYLDLAKLVQSDESPDTFPFETSNYPYGIYQNLFQTIDGVVDTNTEDWVDYKSIIDKFNWGGKVYTPIVDVNPATLLWYRKSIIEENGLDDPWELFEKGEWTWSKCIEMARKFTDPDNAKYAFDGYGLDHAFIATTGKPLIGLENGKLVSNLYDANIEKCMDMLRTFDDTQEQLRYPREIENNWTPSYNEWADGNTLFIEDGTWRYEETWRKFKKKNKWEDDEINFEFKNGIGPDIADSTNGENAVGHLTSDVIMGGNSYTTVRDENKGVIEARIKELNATVS